MKGDIVMYAEPGSMRYVTHRIWEIRNGKIQTWGDNCVKPDAWIPTDAVWGKIILIERGKRKIMPNPEKGIRWARFWHVVGKYYRTAKWYTKAIILRIRKQKVETSDEDQS